MLIRRCAWHEGYFGFPLFMDLVSDDGGDDVQCTDGMCGECLVLFHDQARRER